MLYTNITNKRFFYLFLMQHPWSKTVRVAIDLEAMGIGGKSTIFQVCLLITINFL